MSMATAQNSAVSGGQAPAASSVPGWVWALGAFALAAAALVVVARS